MALFSSGDALNPTVTFLHRPLWSSDFIVIAIILLPKIIELFGHLRLDRGKQVGVPIRDIDALMPHPICNGHSAVTHVNQKRNVGMPEVMDTDPLNPCRLGTAGHLVVEKAFRHRKQPISRLQILTHRHIVFQLIAEKLGHQNLPLALGSLGFGDDVFALDIYGC